MSKKIALAVVAAAFGLGNACKANDGGGAGGDGGQDATGGNLVGSGGEGGGNAGGEGGASSKGGQGGAGGTRAGGSGGAAPNTGGGSGGTAPKFGIDSLPATQPCKLPEAIDKFPARLSLTGCFDAQDPRKPVASLIPYTVSSPLWSDAADKERFLALPVGAKIRVKDCLRAPDECKPVGEGGTTPSDGKLDVPDGSVFIKTFKLAGKYIEARFLVRFDKDNWAAYTYEWRDDQTDADLMPDTVGGKMESIPNGAGMQTWHYPDRAQCFRCHTQAAGTSLGPELRQLNIDYAYPSGVTSNQIDTLEHLGVFEANPMRPLAAPYPAPTKDSAPATVAARARSYLHANCAICHRPKGNFEAIDLRFDATPAEMKICNVVPEKGDLGVAGALRMVPGQPGKSLMALRMRALDLARMPEIGTRVVDDDGVAVLEAWIQGLGACP